MQPQKPLGQLLMIGCGYMGGALLQGWLKHDVVESVAVVDPMPRDWLKEEARVTLYTGPDKLPDDYTPDAALIAIKPQLFEKVLDAYKEILTSETVIVSIAAGQTTGGIANYFVEKTPVLRVMPNLPVSLGEGVMGCIGNDALSDSHKEALTPLLECAGEVVWLEDEEQMHVLTALSGSGPAYIFYVVEAFAKAAEELGLPEEMATTLARQTVIGSAAMLKESDEEAGALREQVTSPGGTTAAGLSEWMRGSSGLDALVRDVLVAASQRSKELA